MIETYEGKEVIWKPQPRQERALTCPAYLLLYGGAAGGGKSDFLLADFLRGLKYGADHKGILFRKSYRELEEIITRSKALYFPIGGHFAKSELTWTFPGGATFKFRHLDTEDDVHNYQGHQFSYAAFDEITNWATDFCFIYIMSRVRSAAGIPCYVRLAGNPGGKGHAWVKHRFIDGKKPEKVYIDPITRISSTFIPAKIDDNQVLMQNDPEYKNRLMMLPVHLRKALLEGDWDVFSGQVFDEFKRDKHVIEPIALSNGWRKFCALDWGYAKPFSVGWYAMTPEGRVIRYREWYGCEFDKPNTGIKMDPKSVAEQAWRMSAGDGVDTMIADPACWISQGMQTQDGRDITIERYFRMAGFTMIKGINSRLNGKMRFHELLKTEGWDGKPMFQVFSTCTHFIRTIPQLTVDPKKPEDIGTDLEDHIYDECRYAIMSNLASDAIHVNNTWEDFELPEKQEYKPLTFEL